MEFPVSKILLSEAHMFQLWHKELNSENGIPQIKKRRKAHMNDPI